MSASQLYKEKAIDGLLRSDSKRASGRLSTAVSLVQQNTRQQLALSSFQLQTSLTASKSPVRLSQKTTRSVVLRSASTGKKIDDFAAAQARTFHYNATVTEEEKERIFNKLYQDFLERNAREQTQVQRAPECSFKPTITKVAQELEQGGKVQQGLVRFEEMKAEAQRRIQERENAAKALKDPAHNAPRFEMKTGPERSRSTQLYQKAAEYKQHREELIKQAQQKELTDNGNVCTFQPQVNTENVNLNGEKNVFLRMQIMDKVAKAKIDKKRIEQAGREAEACPFKPKINAKPLDATNPLNRLPAHERMYVEAKIFDQIAAEKAARLRVDYSFQPQINSNSDLLSEQRKKRIESRVEEGPPPASAPVSQQEAMPEAKLVLTDGQYSKKMARIYKKGQQLCQARDNLTMLGESTQVLLANTVHTSKTSDKLASLRMERHIQRIYKQLKDLSGGVVGYQTSCQAIPQVRCTEAWRMICLQTLVSAGIEAELGEQQFCALVNRIAIQKRQEGLDLGFTAISIAE